MTAADLLLKERARALARPIAPPRAVELMRKLVVFVVGEERYAVEPTQVTEVVALPVVTTVPLTPPTIAGIVSHLGSILPIVDVQPLFGPPRERPAGLYTLLVVQTSSATFGLLADDVVGVQSIPEARVSPPDAGGQPRSVGRGLADDGTLILDLDALARDPRVCVDETP